MKIKLYAIAWLLILLLSGPAKVSAQDAKQPPLAEKKPKILTTHGQGRVDEYFWLRERDNPQVIEYLNAENDYMKSQLAPTEELQQQLFEETKARIKQDDTSAPIPDRGYSYYFRTEEGQQYPIYCRRKLLEPEGTVGPEQILLDENKLAEGHEFLSVSGFDVSTNNNLLALAIDFVGRRKYTMRILNLETGQWLADQVDDMTGNLAWAEDNKTLFYTRQDPETLRSYQVFRHEIGTDPANDAIVFQEDDEEFSCYVGKTRSRKYILIVSNQTLSSEVLYIDAENPHQQPQVIQPRERDHEYSVDHYGDFFYVLTNWNARNFRLMKTPVLATDKSHWQEIVPHDENVLLEEFDLFEKHLVLEQRREGLTRLKIVPWDSNEQAHELDFGEPCYVASSAVIPDPQTRLAAVQFFLAEDSAQCYRLQHGNARKTRGQRGGGLGWLSTKTIIAPNACGRPRGTEPRFLCRSCITRTRHSMEPPPAWNTDTVPTATAWTRRSTFPFLTWSIVDSCTPLPTFGAARKWVASGMTTANC